MRICCEQVEEGFRERVSGIAEEPIAASGILGSTVRFAFRRKHDTVAAGIAE